MKNKNIEGVILAGGKSSRMGRNKLFLEFGNEVLVQRMYNFISQFFERITIVSNVELSNEQIVASVIPDIYIEKGPLGGIHSALKLSKTDKIFVIAVDTPFLSNNIINQIISVGNYDIVATQSNGFINPMPVLISKSCYDYIEINLAEKSAENSKSKNLSIKNLFDVFDSKIIELDNDITNEMFNVNTNNDYMKALEIFNKMGGRSDKT